MKKELGDCTSLFNLCFLFSISGGGCRRSISLESTCIEANRVGKIEPNQTPEGAKNGKIHVERIQKEIHQPLTILAFKKYRR
jgi:hypothetical protein